MKYLIDTPTISEPVRPRPDASVLRWFESHEEADMFLSALTLGELQKGVARLPEGSRRIKLMRWIDEDLRNRFANRVLPVDGEVARVWGDIIGSNESRGRPLPVVDSLIAATAIHHGLTIVTRNTSDFLPTGAPLENPWTSL